MISGVINFGRLLLFGLIPPERPAPDAPVVEHEKYRKGMRRWSKFVAVALWLGAGFFLALLLPTYGRMLGLSWPGDAVAWTSDLKAEIAPVQAQLARVSSGQDEMLLAQYRADLDRARARQCKAIADGDAERKEIYRRQIEETQKKYKKIAGEEWRVPGCEEY